MTRQEIGVAIGVSPATVSNVVGELLQQGVLVEAGVEDSEGGRPRVLLEVCAAYGHVVGVDVGETAILVEMFDLNMKVLASHTSRAVSTGMDVEQVVAQILSGIADVVASSAVPLDSIIGVGVGVPGLVEHGDDAIVYAQAVGWDAVPLGRLLRKGTDLTLVVDNGAKAFGQAEKWFGAARGCENAVILLCGTGVGTCIITDGELYRGSSSSAGEFGHTTVAIDGRRCRCGALGCLDAYAGAEAIVARYDELAEHPATSPADLVTTVTEIASAGPENRAATMVCEETATYLGSGIADLINLFNPERIVIGGWVGMILGRRLLPLIQDVASKHALRLPFSQVEITLAELGSDAVALGAATLPVGAFLASGAVPARRRALTRPQVPAPNRPA